jgi:uncharacterized protein (TIGR03083 family)
MDYLPHLAADAARLREVAARDLAAPVPSCPGWTVTDLVRHTAEAYLHKTECMRLGTRPADWAPDLGAEEPLALFDRAYAALTAEFTARPPGSPAWTWYAPEQTVGFWVRRMAQETVIHRVDAELAAGENLAPIPDDLAVDGVDEVLEVFLGYASRTWPEDFGDLLDGCDGRTALRVTTEGRSWLARLAKDGIVIAEPDSPSASAAAAVSGPPGPVLRWLWRRAGDEVVSLDGDPALVAKLRELLGAATQ